MKRRPRISADEWQYGLRTSEEVRTHLLRVVLDFVRAARGLRGVERIALLGSLLSAKPRPKDVDVLVSIGDDVDFETLARLARRLQGAAQQINSGSDVFIADAAGTYIGRICQYRECRPRVRCRARHCGARPHLNDDLDAVLLPPELVAAPPAIVHPGILASGAVPPDVEALVFEPLRKTG
ncbi:MAG: DUF6932 family protein [Betaproteobacteria bacterium]